MAYYAMVVPAYTGHVNPTMVLGRALQRREHRVAILSPLAAEARVRKAGLEFIPVASAEFPNGEWERLTAQNGKLTGLKATRFACRWLSRLTKGLLRDLPQIVRRERFDGLVMDQLSLGTESVCELMGLPLAVACNSLMAHFESRVPPLAFAWAYRTPWPFRLRNVAGQLFFNIAGWPLVVELLRFRRQNKLPRLTFNFAEEMPPSLVQVAQTPAFFDFPRRRLPDHFYHTGPWTEPEIEANGDFPWDRLDGRPLIYASLGTLQNGLEHVFRVVAEACAELPVQSVLALGRSGAAAPGVLPGQPVVVGYAPQLALLQRAQLAITHGGLNTALECLSAGVPLVVLPITNDQPGVAARAVRLGVGEFIPIRKVTAPSLRQAVSRVLNSPSYRARAGHCAEHIRRLNGLVLAAELVEAALTRRHRLSRIGRVAP